MGLLSPELHALERQGRRGRVLLSSPIDPFDLSKDWGRSDDDRRHRLVVNGALHTSPEPGQTPWTKLNQGFELSGTVQYYSSLPFNITSGVTTVQGTAGRPLVNGTFISRNAGKGPDFLTTNLRLSRTIPLCGRARLEALAEVFNLTNRENVVALNGNFGSGAYPTNASPTFRQILGSVLAEVPQSGSGIPFPNGRAATTSHLPSVLEQGSSEERLPAE